MAKQIIIFFLYLALSVFVSFIIEKKTSHLIGRKILHILMFGTWLIYIFLLDFLTGIILAIVVNIPLAIYSIKSKEFGLITYGLILLFFILDKEHKELNTTRLAVLAFADGLAPIAATIFSGVNKRISNINNKTYVGSFCFFLVSFCVLSITINPLISVFIALLLTIVEYVSENDNLMLAIVMVLLL